MRKKAKFKLGDYTFGKPFDLKSFLAGTRKPPRQIHNAPPPTYLEGLAVESDKTSRSAKELLKGVFCGHGEPAMTVFDLMIDGERELEFAFIDDKKASVHGRNKPLLVMRRPGAKKWRVLFDRKWEDRQQMLIGVRPRGASARETKLLHRQHFQGQLSIGFEYPGDAESRDDVSWLTIDAWAKGDRKPFCLINAELA